MSEKNEKKRRNQNKYECRNVMYFVSNDNQDDLLLINEKVHKPDGTIESRLRQVFNFEKPFYVHKEAFRKYTQKQLWKPKSEMDVYWSTERTLLDDVKRVLGIPLGRYMPRRQVFRSPYVYGADTSTTTIMRKKYLDAFPGVNSPATVAVLDIETNVNSEEGEIIAISLSFGKKAIVATTKDFLGTTPLPEKKFREKCLELIPEVIIDRKVEIEFFIGESSVEAVQRVLQRAHEWKPDFITGWNLMAFDIPKIIEEFERAGLDPARYFSSPEVDPRFHRCKYMQGKTKHRTREGNERPLANYEQWHWLDTPAQFFFIDAMCLYYQIRKGKPLEENYRLDTILNKELGEGKLRIAETDHLDGLEKHSVEQSKYKIEYLVYNLFDCVGIELLDEKTKDLSRTFPVLAGVSDFGKYTSGPSILVDALSFYVQEDERFQGVLATASDDLALEIDKYVPGLSEWIVTLPTERLLDTGMDILEELPGWKTKVHAQTSDIDVSSGYPNIERAMNMSKTTTVHELHRIDGITYREQQLLGLSMLGGKANSLMFAEQVYKLPNPVEVYKLWEQQKTMKAP